jgi:hypothetical protein
VIEKVGTGAALHHELVMNDGQEGSKFKIGVGMEPVWLGNYGVEDGEQSSKATTGPLLTMMIQWTT